MAFTSPLLSYDGATSALTLTTGLSNPSADTVSLSEVVSGRLRVSLGTATFDVFSTKDDSRFVYSTPNNPGASTYVDILLSSLTTAPLPLASFAIDPGAGADSVTVNVPTLSLGRFSVTENATDGTALTVIAANASGFDGTARTIAVTGRLNSSGGSAGVTLTATGGGLSVVGGSVFSGSNAIALSGDGRATGTDGVRLSEANLSTFGPGGIRITGTGGAGATGVSVGDGSQVTTAERGDIVIDGTGGAAGNGVFIGGTRIGPNMTTDSSTVRASGRTFAGGSPAIIITGTASAGASDIAVQDSGVVGSMFGAGPVSFIADSVNIGTGIASAAGTVLASTFGVRTRTAGRAIDLGGTDSATALGLTSAELNRVTASRIDIGTRTGGITVSSDIVGPADTSFALGADGDTGNIKFLGGFTLTPGRTAPTLTLKAPGGGLIQPLRSGADITGATTLAPSSTLAVDINGTVPNTGYSRLVVAGTLGVADALLKLTGTYAPVVGDTFAIVSSSALTGTFRNLAQDATLIFNGRTLRVNYTATGVVLTVLDTTVVPPPPAPVHLSAVSFGPHVIAYDEDGSVCDW